tara:strand:+ start:223 stop:759 length:537 start_codon:yes stop_codon:yes gene_type:complete
VPEAQATVEKKASKVIAAGPSCLQSAPLLRAFAPTSQQFAPTLRRTPASPAMSSRPFVNYKQLHWHIQLCRERRVPESASMAEANRTSPEQHARQLCHGAGVAGSTGEGGESYEHSRAVKKRAARMIQRAWAEYVEDECIRCYYCNWLYPIERLQHAYATDRSGAWDCPVCEGENSML